MQVPVLSFLLLATLAFVVERVFAADAQHRTSRASNSYVPHLVGNRPQCAGPYTFCADVVTDYPVEYIRKLLQKEKVLNSFFTRNSRKIRPTVRANGDEESTLCLSRKQVLYPRVGKTKDNEWLYVVNLDDQIHKQPVVVELCSYPNEKCPYSEGFPATLSSYCRQSYISTMMVVLLPDATLGLKQLLLPSCCVCKTTTTDGARRGR